MIYQIYPRSFADANGDGIGDLAGITERLDALVSLGIDAVWLSPFYRSPQRDAGYDVADYCDVDPIFGTLADFDALLARAHQLGLRVIIDLVPNHTSSAHPWFVEALAAAARVGGAPALPLPGRADGLAVGLRRQRLDPGAGRAVVHAPVRRGPARSQLALPRRTRVVRRRAALLARPRGRRLPRRRRARAGQGRLASGPSRVRRCRLLAKSEAPYWDQDEVHEIYRSWRALLDEYTAADPARPAGALRGGQRAGAARRPLRPRPTRCTRPSTSPT